MSVLCTAAGALRRPCRALILGNELAPQLLLGLAAAELARGDLQPSTRIALARALFFPRDAIGLWHRLAEWLLLLRATRGVSARDSSHNDEFPGEGRKPTLAVDVVVTARSVIPNPLDNRI